MPNSNVKLSNPTGRNTSARRLDIGENSFYFSYETCIAFDSRVAYSGRGPSRERCRLANVWGPTTGRHFRELGCVDFTVLPPDEFEALLATAFSFAVSLFDQPVFHYLKYLKSIK